MAFKKYFKRAAKRVYRKVVRPYVNKKKGYRNRMKLYNEINQIKRMVNAEKKYVEGNHTGVGVGQLAGGVDGIVCLSITPAIAVGAAYNQRNGNSVKLSGMYFRGQFVAQVNLVNMLRMKLTVVRVKGAPQTTANIITGVFDPDSLSGVRDYNCSRNPTQFTDYIVMYERSMVLYPDNIAGQQSNFNFNIPMKLDNHIRWNTAGVIQEGEIFIILRADNGDSGSPSTGSFFSCSFRMSYYDN